MTYREYFTPDEWATLKLSVLWIFQAISQADGKIDIKEIEAMWAVRHNSTKFGNDLLKEVLESLDYDFEVISNKYNMDAWEIQNGLRKTADILDYLEPNDAREFKKSLVAIGNFISDAAGNWLSRLLWRRESQTMRNIRQLIRLSDRETREYPTPQDILDNFESLRTA